MESVAKSAASLRIASIPFLGRTGQGVRIAVIDSGVHASHPHIRGVAGGVTIGDQIEEGSFDDVLGHGTAVMAAIKEKAPDASYFAVRVFQSSLRTGIEALQRAIEWSIDQKIHILNLSLGTVNPAHMERFRGLVVCVAEAGAVVVSANDAHGKPSLPGSLPGVIGVSLDWDLPRESYSCQHSLKNGWQFGASGYPRAIPGISPQRNLHGISFAVANMTGFVARAFEGLHNPSYESLCSALAAEARQPDRQSGPPPTSSERL